MSSYRIEVGRYRAEGETGARYIVIVCREDQEHSPLWSSRNPLSGTHLYQLDDGRELRFLGKGEFEVVETGEIIWRC